MSMRVFKIPYGKTYLEASIPEDNVAACLTSKKIETQLTEQEEVDISINNPIGSPMLSELARDAKRVLFITNDMTRPMPSKITMPAIIREIQRYNAKADITLLIASGLHRKMTREELIDKMGHDLVENYKIVVHDAYDKSRLVYMGNLSSGNPLWLNKEVIEHDLVISEGFIEAHWLGGFSGGRKSILPGISGADTVMNNHSPQNIDDLRTKPGILEGNPAHEEFCEAARKANLKFILNVVLDKNKHIIKAFAGDTFEAHYAGCEFVRKMMEASCEPSDIVITSNNGYPLDLNLYQSIKGMDTASAAIKEGGVIIMVTECSEGIGHGGFLHVYEKGSGQEEILKGLRDGTIREYDQWAAQIMLKLTRNYKVIVVTDNVPKDKLKDMYLEHADDIGQALDMAFEIKGKNAMVNIIPEGPVIIPIFGEKKEECR